MKSQHRSNVAGYAKIAYPGLYQGIDLLTWGHPTGMKYEFHVAPGADWRNIQVSYGGSGGLSLAADGSLHIATPLGDLVEEAPVLYQVVDGNRMTVAGRFVLLDADKYGFVVTGMYDPSRELVIDPDLAWATYLGGAALMLVTASPWTLSETCMWRAPVFRRAGPPRVRITPRPP